MRTIIDVPDDIIESLDRIGGREKRSRTALIREAISIFLQQKSLPEAEAAFGLWKGRSKDGLTYQNAIRSDWDR